MDSKGTEMKKKCNFKITRKKPLAAFLLAPAPYVTYITDVNCYMDTKVWITLSRRFHDECITITIDSRIITIRGKFKKRNITGNACRKRPNRFSRFCHPDPVIQKGTYRVFILGPRPFQWYLKLHPS